MENREELPVLEELDEDLEKANILMEWIAEELNFEKEFCKYSNCFWNKK